jgi:hypothetical protein
VSRHFGRNCGSGLTVTHERIRWAGFDEWSNAGARSRQSKINFGGHPDVEGLCLALVDWSEELRIMEAEREKPPGLNPAAGGKEIGLVQPLME